MKQYLLDTNICAFILRDKYDVKSLILEIGIDNCHISLVTENIKHLGKVDGVTIENWINR